MRCKGGAPDSCSSAHSTAAGVVLQAIMIVCGLASVSWLGVVHLLLQ